jgi:hypothetical protein
MTGSLQNQATTNSNNINSLISLTGALQTQKIGDAPADSQQYARINNAWAVVQTSSGGSSVNAPTDGVVYGITGSSYIPLISRTSAGANTRTGLSSDRFVSFTGLTSAQSYILPEANSVPAGTPIVIANEDGTCKPYLKILVTPAGTDLLNGLPAISSSQEMYWPYSTLSAVSNGTNGWMVSNINPTPNNGALNSYKGAIICDEDWFYPQSGNQNGWRMQNSGTTMNTAQTQTILGGSVLSCGTSAQYSGFGFANPAIGGIMIPRYYSNFFCEWRLNLTLFDLTNNAKLFVGFFNSIATDPTRGAYFEINTNSGATNASTNWTATIMPRTGVTVRQDTGIAFGTAGIWTLGVDVTYGGDTRFYINGVLATTITTPYSDSTSNSADNVTPAIRGQGVAGSARNADIDRTRFGMIMNPVTHLRYS